MKFSSFIHACFCFYWNQSEVEETPQICGDLTTDILFMSHMGIPAFAAFTSSANPITAKQHLWSLLLPPDRQPFSFCECWTSTLHAVVHIKPTFINLYISVLKFNSSLLPSLHYCFTSSYSPK